MPLHRLINYGLLALAIVCAGWRGGKPERIVVALMLAATILSPLLRTSGATPFLDLDWGLAAVDACLWAVVVAIALVSTRFWPMGAAALLSASLLAHAAAVLTEGDRAYAISEVAPSYVLPLLIVWATWRHQRRLRRYGWDPSWVRELPAEYLLGRRVRGIGDEPGGGPEMGLRTDEDGGSPA